MGAIALCTLASGCSDDGGDGGGDDGPGSVMDASLDGSIRQDAQPYDPNWTDFDARVDLDPDAEPPAKQHVWADWNTASPTLGTAGATFAISGPDGGLSLTYSGSWNNIQLDGGLPYWTPGTAYTSAAVPNSPTPTELIMLAGGNNSVHTLTFSAPVTDPVLAIMSLGSADTTTVCRFDSDFELLSHGPGYYQSAQELKHLPDNKLSGRESNGPIRFKDTYTTIRWVAEISEPWYGLTVGLPTPQ